MSKKENFLCPECGCVMELKENMPKVKISGSPYKMRSRRFACPVCEHEETIYAGGSHIYFQQEREKDLTRKEKNSRNNG